ncbi:MAG: hypothetical protein WCO57_06265 [Verrucomicrobiota bacterium]
MKRFLNLPLAAIGTLAMLTVCASGADKLRDHEVVLDKDGRLQPWTSYDNVLKWSMNFIKRCPTVPTKFGDDPWYLVTSKLSAQGEFLRNQNCQASHAYWAMETLARYYPYTGDEEAIQPVRRILDRVLHYHTPAAWAWPNVPSTQDDSPDGEYTDERSEPDKMSLAGVAYLKFYKLTGEEKYLQAARGIATTLAAHVQPGDENKSPLPFRVNMKTGKVVDGYSAAMISPVVLFDEMLHLGESGEGKYLTARDALWKWLLDYPVKNHKWSGYYEDMVTNVTNMNQQSPMETARFMLRHPELDPDYKRHVPELLAWVKDRFGKTKHHGATSIKEQDICFLEMCSHTARYASVNAKWYDLTQDPAYREEARAAFALSIYSVYSKHSKDQSAINYVGITYTCPWFVDSYFDFLCHIQDGMTELPDMAPADADHVIGSDSIINKIKYQPGRIAYTTFEPKGSECLRLTFKPAFITADGKELAAEAWTYGDYNGVSGVLRIHRSDARSVVISKP